MRNLALIALLAATGCQTLEDVRASAPARSGRFATDYRALSACAAARLQPDYSISYILQEHRRLATITHVADNGFVRYAPYEIIVRGDDADGSVAEIRTFTTVWGGPGADTGRFWHALAECDRNRSAHQPPHL